MFNGFQVQTVERDGVRLHTRVGGAGSPLLLLHGHPQCMAMWHKVLPALAARHRVVLMDLRGYGDSDRPPADAAHLNHSKRAMALDAIAVMQAHGFERFDVLAHDRGARVAHRLAADHAQAVQRLMLLDIAPTLAMYENTSEAFARAYWHWFALIQPGALPEALIDTDPARYVRGVMGGRHAGLAPFTPEALAEYERCFCDPLAIHAACEDYRASAGLDLEHDRASRAAGEQIRCDLLAIWGTRGVIHKLFDPVKLWSAQCAGRVSALPLDAGHFIPEERPAETAAALQGFFGG